jgi:ParB-like chromosome segregation protein Spo0J
MTAALVSTTDRPYQLLPPLTVEQRHILRQSIEENGVLEPVVFDEDGEILDGHHRVEIAEELGIEYPRRVIDDLDRPGKHMYALTVNVARRQLDQSTRGSLVAQLRLRGMSIRQHRRGDWLLTPWHGGRRCCSTVPVWTVGAAGADHRR